AVRVPLLVRPPGGCDPKVVDVLVEHLDVPASMREIAGAPELSGSEARSLIRYLGDDEPSGRDARDVPVSQSWGVAALGTERSNLVVDEDACAACQLFDLREDPAEDHDLLPDSTARPLVDELMETYVRPFFATPPARPHESIFTG